MATIFPTSPPPQVNDVYQGYLYNGTAWEIIGINLNDVPTGPTGPSGDLTLTIVPAKTSTYTLSLEDKGKLIEVDGTFNVNIPTDSVELEIGTQITILNIGSGVITIGESSPETTTLNGTPGLKLRTRWSTATLIKRAANTWVAVGDLTV
jgi:hypothetical protein